MKKYAIYLPQFHEIEENNQWWGKGYTEWTCVNNARALFTNHNQPKLPLNDNYYNLLNPDTLCWQSKLANEYGIDGFIFYHYWFNGKLIMEKPIEVLYQNKNIDISFYFCWANHTWYKGTGINREILIEQTYGDKNSWEEHYKYLSKYFKDVRYVKKSGCPLLMLYETYFPEKEEMMQYFNKRAIEDGFNGIYLIEVYKENLSKKRVERFLSNKSSITQSILLREPSVSLAEYYRFHPLKRIILRVVKPFFEKRNIIIPHVRKIRGDKLFNHMLKYDIKGFSNISIIPGLFFEWDNTPRHKYRGYIITPPAKKRFNQYMEKVKNEDQIVINAWNEWAEGMMIEPTKDDGYKYLEWLKGCEESNDN